MFPRYGSFKIILNVDISPYLYYLYFMSVLNKTKPITIIHGLSLGCTINLYVTVVIVIVNLYTVIVNLYTVIVNLYTVIVNQYTVIANLYTVIVNLHTVIVNLHTDVYC